MEDLNNEEEYNNLEEHSGVYNNLNDYNNLDGYNSCEDSNSVEEYNNIDRYNNLEEFHNLGEFNKNVSVEGKYLSKDWGSKIVEVSGDSNKNSKFKKEPKFKYVRNSTGLVTLYITSCEENMPTKLSIETLKAACPHLNLDSTIETEYGLIINLQNDTYIQKLLQLNLAKIFNRPVQAVPLYSGSYLKIVSFNQIPWCIRVEEIEHCLEKQGIKYGRITREKSTLYVEVTDFPNYQRLREEGINFYNSVMFQASEEAGLNEEIHYNSDDIIQCYKCQGFWHTANTCKQNVRCVRCGEQHQVENCNRPKSSPICCNCKGPHHAAYKLCPVRLKLQKSVRVSFLFDQ